MPHLMHATDLEIPCTQCHEFGVHKDVRLKEPKACEECH
jgi:hypothetical protein